MTKIFVSGHRWESILREFCDKVNGKLQHDHTLSGIMFTVATDTVTYEIADIVGDYRNEGYTFTFVPYREESIFMLKDIEPADDLLSTLWKIKSDTMQKEGEFYLPSIELAKYWADRNRYFGIEARWSFEYRLNHAFRDGLKRIRNSVDSFWIFNQLQLLFPIPEEIDCSVMEWYDREKEGFGAQIRHAPYKRQHDLLAEELQRRVKNGYECVCWYNEYEGRIEVKDNGDWYDFLDTCWQLPPPSTTVFTNKLLFGKYNNENFHIIQHELCRFWEYRLDNAEWYHDLETDVIFSLRSESAFFAIYKPGVEIDFVLDYFGKGVKENLIKWKF